VAALYLRGDEVRGKRTNPTPYSKERGDPQISGREKEGTEFLWGGGGIWGGRGLQKTKERAFRGVRGGHPSSCD